MTMTPAQRRKRCNEKKREQGLIPLHVWVPARDKESTLKYVARLVNKFESEQEKGIIRLDVSV